MRNGNGQSAQPDHGCGLLKTYSSFSQPHNGVIQNSNTTTRPFNQTKSTEANNNNT